MNIGHEILRTIFGFVSKKITKGYNISNISNLTAIELVRFSIENRIPFGSLYSWEKIDNKFKEIESFYTRENNLDKWTYRQPVWKNVLKLKKPVTDNNILVHMIKNLYYSGSPWLNYVASGDEWNAFLDNLKLSPIGEELYYKLLVMGEPVRGETLQQFLQEYVVYRGKQLIGNFREVKLLNHLKGFINDYPATGSNIKFKGVVLIPDCLGFMNTYRKGTVYCEYVFNYLVMDKDNPESLYYFEHTICPDPDSIHGTHPVLNTGDEITCDGLIGQCKKDLLVDMWVRVIEYTKVKFE